MYPKAHAAATAAPIVHCRRCGALTSQDVRGDGHPWCSACQRPDWVNPAPAVGIAIVRDGNVLLAKRGRAPYEGQWDLVGGFIEPGETVPEAARREALEETGLTIQRLRRLHQAAGEYVPGQPTLNFMYVAEADGPPTAADDVAELAWFPFDRLPEMAWPHEAEALAKLTLSKVQ